MLRIFQISSEVNSGSVGRIAEQIGEAIIKQGWESFIAFGREGLASKSKTFTIGDYFDKIMHGVYTRITDRHGFGSKKATRVLIDKIKEIDPDIIHLQHLHGYYINIEILFEYLKESKKPVVWTFHDCWSFTGHCAHYEFINCQKWLTQCESCPQKGEYPKSSLLDNSYRNYLDKKRIFNSVDNITIVPVSNWLGREVKKSFLKGHKLKVIQNGIDLEVFNIFDHTTNQLTKERLNVQNEFIILGVASPWSEKKGLQFFIKLANILPEGFKIILLGLSPKQLRSLPPNINGLERTENVKQLAELYSAADVFLNPTLEDTFPTTNLESLACGTPVITFNSGGSPEAVNSETGFVVEKGDLESVVNIISELNNKDKAIYSEKCRNRAMLLFDKKKNYENYIELYKQLV